MKAAESVRSIAPTAWSLEEFLVHKGAQRVSLCFPCRDEMATIGPLVAQARHALLDTGLIDELVVLDDRSADDTGAVASANGANVHGIEAVHRRHGVGHGKGNALWSSLLVTSGDIVVWCDGDVTSFAPEWVVRLVAPLLVAPELVLVKAAYARPETNGGGGRTTELVARPLLSMFAPGLAPLAQPLSGEFAGRRSALESIPFVQGWGVEIAMLLDVAARYGPAAIAQVDLGMRVHRHRNLQELSVQAAEVLATALQRLGRGTGLLPTLARSDEVVIPLNLSERPPVAELRHDLTE
ncbi:MAG: glucosyl-3-phosphoglycerate synthase [Acidimicrobiia bacterium]